jgi:hypothetical protein
LLHDPRMFVSAFEVEIWPPLLCVLHHPGKHSMRAGSPHAQRQEDGGELLLATARGRIESIAVNIRSQGIRGLVVRSVANPTDAVGGSFILSLQTRRRPLAQIPPTQSVDGSYSAYETRKHDGSRIPPTQSVDGSYSAYKLGVVLWHKSHRRSRWIVHT